MTDRVKVFDSEEATARAVAELVAQRISEHEARAEKRDFVLGLFTGGTAVPVYEAMLALEAEGRLSLAHVTTVNLDEYWHIPLGHPECYRRFMDAHLFSRSTTLHRGRTFVPPTDAADAASAAQEYERRIRELGGVDLWLIGIGHNGHVAFNEPGSSFDSRTRLVTLTERTIEANSRFFDGDKEKVPHQAMSVGIATILDAREVVLVAYGEGKADAIARAVQGPVTTDCPASALQRHAHAEFYVDKEAASKLRQ